MPAYHVSAADRAPLPASYAAEPRYLKYTDSELSRPFAKYFRTQTRPVQEHVHEALLAGRAPTEYGYDVSDVAARLGRPGYENMETGWTRGERGAVTVCVRTAMPGVTAAMWDWWFGWHSTDSARYKLWHPDAHQYCAIGQDRSADRALSDRQRYVNNVSYVDEYIGGTRHRLAIRFVDPATLGITERSGTTHICARVTLSNVPLAAGWLVHQVRPTADGAEMRSRFFLNYPQVLDLPAHCLPSGVQTRVLRTPLARAVPDPVLRTVASRIIGPSIGADLLYHCAAEMNHLAGFLPALYEEFRGTP